MLEFVTIVTLFNLHHLISGKIHLLTHIIDLRSQYSGLILHLNKVMVVKGWNQLIHHNGVCLIINFLLDFHVAYTSISSQTTSG